MSDELLVFKGRVTCVDDTGLELCSVKGDDEIIELEFTGFPVDEDILGKLKEMVTTGETIEIEWQCSHHSVVE